MTQAYESPDRLAELPPSLPPSPGSAGRGLGPMGRGCRGGQAGEQPPPCTPSSMPDILYREEPEVVSWAVGITPFSQGKGKWVAC